MLSSNRLVVKDSSNKCDVESDCNTCNMFCAVGLNGGDGLSRCEICGCNAHITFGNATHWPFGVSYVVW